MKKANFSSIKTKIFVSYGSLILIICIFTSLLYYYTAYNAFLKNYTKSSRQLSKIVSHQLDQYFEQINSIQKKILENDEIRDYIFVDAASQDFESDREFQKTIYTITGYDFGFFHMNILNLEDHSLINFGSRYIYTPSEDYTVTPEIQENIIDPAVALRGRKFIVPPGHGSLNIVDEDTPTLSFVRSFPRYSYSLSEPKGVIEIQVTSSSIQELLEATLLSYDNQAESIYIFDEEGRLVYPLDLPDEELKYYISLDTENKNDFKNPFTHKSEIVAGTSSSRTGFTVLLCTPDSALQSNKSFFRNVSLIIAAVSLLLLIALTYRLASSISSPIIKLKESIASLSLDSISEKSAYHADTSLNELEMLSDAYNHMQLRLKESLDDIVRSRTLSIHSQIMALQAQMDSHFLYNTLTIISIIAEENDDIQASEMCVKLTRMLRYITEDLSKSTTFSGELEHTRNYTDLMAIRYGGQICFEYETEPSLSSVCIPRLVIQPLVENCVKYSRSPDRPLHILIRTWQDKDSWCAEISDNGSGFSKEVVDGIYEKIKKLDQEEAYPQIHINGMGLANIYLRLKLFYENDFRFDIENHGGPGDGSSVIIGGRMDHEK